MDCRETRRLLNQGVTPSSYDVLRATLGFHLAMCAECRTYRDRLASRRQMDEQLLTILLAQQPPARSQPLSIPLRHAVRQHSHRRLQAAGVGLMLGGMLALNPTPSSTTPTPIPAPAAAPVAAQIQDDAIQVRRQMYRPLKQTGAASAPTTAELSAPPPVQPGQTLLIPDVQAATTTDRSAQEGVTFYTVKPGDTLSHIALWFYGDASRWPAIHQANPALTNPHLIFPGQRISISPGGSTPTTPTNQVGEGEGMYTVQPGDSLWSIAQQAYGTGAGWIDIFQANERQIADAHWIFPGQQFMIPRQLSSGSGGGNGSGSYVVRSGDSLWSIAQQFYGDGTQYERIHQANQGQVANPRLIFPGMVLTIP